MPVATATASPPLDPPGTREASHGLIVRPNRSLSVSQRSPKSGMLPRPIGMAPAARSRSTRVASPEGTACARNVQPLVVADQVRSMFSFTVNGTPASTPVTRPGVDLVGEGARSIVEHDGERVDQRD